MIPPAAHVSPAGASGGDIYDQETRKVLLTLIGQPAGAVQAGTPMTAPGDGVPSANAWAGCPTNHPPRLLVPNILAEGGDTPLARTASKAERRP